MNGQMSLFTSEVSTSSLFSELDAFLSHLSESIAEGRADATLIPWIDRNAARSIDAIEDALHSLGWVWNASAKHWERGGWLVWFRSQGELASPIAQWSRIKSESPATPPKKHDARRDAYTGPFPRKRHYHRCPKCKEKGSNGVNCYKSRCTSPVLLDHPCSWCR